MHLKFETEERKKGEKRGREGGVVTAAPSDRAGARRRGTCASLHFAFAFQHFASPCPSVSGRLSEVWRLGGGWRGQGVGVRSGCRSWAHGSKPACRYSVSFSRRSTDMRPSSSIPAPACGVGVPEEELDAALLLPPPPPLSNAQPVFVFFKLLICLGRIDIAHAPRNGPKVWQSRDEPGFQNASDGDSAV